MNPQVETALLSALVAGTITLCGWFMHHLQPPALTNSMRGDYSSQTVTPYQHERFVTLIHCPRTRAQVPQSVRKLVGTLRDALRGALRNFLRLYGANTVPADGRTDVAVRR